MNGLSNVLRYLKWFKKENISCDIDEINLEMPVLSIMFKDLYAQRLAAIENDNDLDDNGKDKEKIHVMQKYLDQLHEQNTFFMSVMIELEKEVENRVKQMERKLKSSAKTTLEAVLNLHECEKEIKQLVHERLYVESMYNDMQHTISTMRVENSFLRDQNFSLNHDVQALLHVIQHARSTGNWEMTCVTFCEVTPEQVFGPIQSISNLHENDSSHFELPSDKSNKILETFKKVPSLSSKISHLKCPSSAKQTKCESCKLKLEAAVTHNKKLNTVSPLKSTPLSKCISVPDIGNIYSYFYNVYKSHSLKSLRSSYTPFEKNMTNMGLNYSETSLRKDNDQEFNESSNATEYYSNRRSQSEPHLFMFGDKVYIYRPCETVSSILHISDSYSPTCQSIDLKFPTQDNSSDFDWSILHKSLPEDRQDITYSCPCSSSGARNKMLTKQFNKKIMFSSTQTETVHSQSVGLQVLTHQVEENSRCNSVLENEETFYRTDVCQLSSTIKILKENLMKTDNMVEEKSILVEQLQGHLASVIKEVELKNSAICNLERKLQNSRNECSSLKKEIVDLKVKTNNIIQDLENSQKMNESLKLKMEQQIILIKNLQDALVQSKRAFDSAYLNSISPSANSQKNFQDDTKSSSKHYIVDI